MSNQILTPPELARRYSPSTFDDGWEAVDQYLLVVEWSEINPGASWWDAAKALDLPKTRVRRWYSGEKPLVVKQIEKADDYGWFEATWESEIGRAFNILIAAILSGGWLSENYSVGVRLDDDLDEGVVESIKKALEVLVSSYRIAEREDSEPGAELLPGKDRTLLGRAVNAIGVKKGKKTEGELTLPEYLTTAPEARRQEFVDLYVAMRGSSYESGKMVLREERPKSYLNPLAALVEGVTGETVWTGERAIYLSKDSAQALDESYVWGERRS
jgi:hypothetical protein